MAGKGRDREGEGLGVEGSSPGDMEVGLKPLGGKGG